MLLVIDNYDSFTYNLVQYCRELGEKVHIVRNDAVDIEDVKDMNPSSILISPGPCTPDEAGISMGVVLEFAGLVPILGVCLGHQSIAQAFGATIEKAKQVMHGKVSPICHNKQGVFRGLPDPFLAMRYHSLMVKRENFPSCLTVTAWTENRAGEVEVIMGLEHKTMPIYGVQFHPESIGTENGFELIKTFLHIDTEDKI